MLVVFLPRGQVFQGFLQDIVPGGLVVGAMAGATATIATGAVFAPGECELLLFVDAVPGGGARPQRGDLAAFDNTVASFGRSTRLVAVDRDPDAVARSLAAHGWWPEVDGERLARRLLEARDRALGRRRHLYVRYESLVADRAAEVARLAAFVGVRDRARIAAAVAFVEPALDRSGRPVAARIGA